MNSLTRPSHPSHHKLAERLSVLNSRAVGLLTRLYHTKFVITQPNYRPKYMPGGDKSFESAVKTVIKKFPASDFKANSSSLQVLTTIRNDIQAQLAVHYYTLVDVLDFKDHFTELLGRISGCSIQMDIKLNFDLTKSYLELVANYFAMIILFTRIEDRKAIIALFNFAYEVTNASQEKSFPRLSTFLQDYESMPYRQLHVELNPHSHVLSNALLSVSDFFARRTLRAKNWQETQLLSILADSSKLIHPVMADTIPCELLSAETMERWIIFGYIMIYPELSNEKAFQLWKNALTSSYIVVLFRDEIFHIHVVLDQFFSELKSCGKRVSEVREFYNQACLYSPQVHRDKRKYLRVVLRELTYVLSDEPGLLGPKAFVVLWALSFAHDEITWLIRHVSNPPHKKKAGGGSGVKFNPDDFVDRFIPELIFYIEELRSLVMKYIQVIQRFHAQMLTCYDAPGLSKMIQTMNLPPEELSILNAIIQQLSDIKLDQVYRDELFNFMDTRIDWFRVQAYLSVSSSPINLKEHQEFAGLMNTTIFHTKMMDYVDEMMKEVSDLSIFYFYQPLVDDFFKKNIEFPAQHRFIIVFPMLCSHFMNACHELCPEERILTGETAFRMAYKFCKEICKEMCNLVMMVCEEQSKYAYELLPHEAVKWMQENMPKGKKHSISNNSVKSSKGSAGFNIGPHSELKRLPGIESFRRYREDFTKMDKLHMALTELAFAINSIKEISVWERGIVPREMFLADLEDRFCKTLGDSVMFRPDSKEIAKPSEMLNSFQAQMSVLMDLENYVSIDITRLFSSVLLQHTQPRESNQGRPTLTFHYTRWYTEIVLPHVVTDTVLFSPLIKSFVTIAIDPAQNFHTEEYADLNELRALAQLLGPYGVKYLSERVLLEVVKVVDELKKLVLQNKDTLESLRCSFDDVQKTRELSALLQHSEMLLKNFKTIGIYLAFKNLLHEALHDVLKESTPFLLASVEDIRLNMTGDTEWGGINGTRVPAEDRQLLTDFLLVNELTSAMGLPSDVDSTLCNLLRMSRLGNPEEEYQIACLLFVFLASTLPRLAKLDSSLYRLDLQAHANNIHCIAYAVNTLEAALFTITGHGDQLEARLKEFLALASSNLLRLTQETVAGTSSSLGDDSNASGNSSGGINSHGEAVGSGSSSIKSDNPAKNRDSIYILLDMIVQQSPYLTADLLESCFPYALVRSAYHNVAKNARLKKSHHRHKDSIYKD